MRTSAWVTILGLAGLAVACGDQPTEAVPDREEEATAGAISRSHSRGQATAIRSRPTRTTTSRVTEWS